MVEEITIFQHWIFSKFVFPFLLLWTITYAVLGKTKILGENKQIDSLVAFVVAFIFIGAFQPKIIVENLILFLTVALIVMFVALLLWGFASGSDLSKDILTNKAVMWIVGIVIVVATVIALLWAAGIQTQVIDLFFNSSWSSDFWTNATFVVIIGIALALVLKTSSK